MRLAWRFTSPNLINCYISLRCWDCSFLPGVCYCSSVVRYFITRLYIFSILGSICNLICYSISISISVCVLFFKSCESVFKVVGRIKYCIIYRLSGLCCGASHKVNLYIVAVVGLTGRLRPYLVDCHINGSRSRNYRIICTHKVRLTCCAYVVCNDNTAPVWTDLCSALGNNDSTMRRISHRNGFGSHLVGSGWIVEIIINSVDIIFKDYILIHSGLISADIEPERLSVPRYIFQVNIQNYGSSWCITKIDNSITIYLREIGIINVIEHCAAFGSNIDPIDILPCIRATVVLTIKANALCWISVFSQHSRIAYKAVLKINKVYVLIGCGLSLDICDTGTYLDMVRLDVSFRTICRNSIIGTNCKVWYAGVVLTYLKLSADILGKLVDIVFIYSRIVLSYAHVARQTYDLVDQKIYVLVTVHINFVEAYESIIFHDINNTVNITWMFISHLFIGECACSQQTCRHCSSRNARNDPLEELARAPFWFKIKWIFCFKIHNYPPFWNLIFSLIFFHIKCRCLF